MTPAPDRLQSRLWRVFRIAYREMFEFASYRRRSVNAFVSPLFLVPTVVFVLRLLRLDREITANGVANAMRRILRRYYRGVSVIRGTVPSSGPVLLVGNHPGLGDLPALAVATKRRDLFAIAKKRALMRDMPGVLSRCVVIDETLSSRARAIRRIVEIAREGGAIVVYPAGSIEPDPALVGADQPILAEWPSFVDGIARRLLREGLSVPVVPVYTEGVHVVPRHFRRVAYRRSGLPHEGRAALITMASRRSRFHAVRIAFGDPIDPRIEFARDTAATGDPVTRRVRREVCELRDSAVCASVSVRRGTEPRTQLRGDRCMDSTLSA